MCATAAGASFSLTFFISYLSSGIFEREEVSVLECRGSSGSRRNLDARDGKVKAVVLLALRLGQGVIFVFDGYPKLFRYTHDSMSEMVQDGLPEYFAYVAGILDEGRIDRHRLGKCFHDAHPQSGIGDCLFGA